MQRNGPYQASFFPLHPRFIFLPCWFPIAQVSSRDLLIPNGILISGISWFSLPCIYDRDFLWQKFIYTKCIFMHCVYFYVCIYIYIYTQHIFIHFIYSYIYNGDMYTCTLYIYLYIYNIICFHRLWISLHICVCNVALPDHYLLKDWNRNLDERVSEI